MQKLVAAVLFAVVASVTGRNDAAAAIAVEATLSGFDAQWFWSINDGKIHADGMGCRARFVLTTPATLAGREIKILFHSSLDEVRENYPGLDTHIGSTYSFELPDDFFDKDYKSIYEYSVKELKRRLNLPLQTTRGDARRNSTSTLRPRALCARA